VKDQGASYYFGAILQPALIMPEQAKMPASAYLSYHREHIFKG
jgi:hypothetical protein